MTDRAGPKRELPRPGQECHPGDVGGHQVGRELDPLELDVEGERQGTHEQCLGRSGHAFE
jgi:hypothetical protein